MRGIKLKRILFLIIFLISGPLLAKYNFRHATLLPIIEKGGQALSYKLFLEVEEYLKKANWAYYESNSKILDVLNRYQDNLGQHLESPDVLQVIANTTGAGSLIKITLTNSGDKTKIAMVIVGENGLDILFKDEKELTSNMENALAVTAISWLNEYSKKIPYDGRILKVQGDKLVLNVGENLGMTRGQFLKISRPIGKKKHPILEEVVWEKREIGTAEIVDVKGNKSIVEVKDIVSENPQTDDWAITGEKAKKVVVAPLAKKEQRPRYGYISLALDIGGGSQTTDITNFQNKFQGFMVGGRLKGEVWFTENWWMGLDLAARVGSLIPGYDYFPNDSETRGYAKIKGGYRFLPSGFFSGPQIDVFVGYGIYSYQPDYVNHYGPIDANFFGVLLGVKGGIPLGNYFRTSLYFDMLFNTEKDKKGGPSYFIELMFNYLFKSYLSFDASISGWGNNWRDIAPGTDIRYKDFSFLLGATYYF